VEIRYRRGLGASQSLPRYVQLAERCFTSGLMNCVIQTAFTAMNPILAGCLAGLIAGILASILDYICNRWLNPCALAVSPGCFWARVATTIATQLISGCIGGLIRGSSLGQLEGWVRGLIGGMLGIPIGLGGWGASANCK